MSVPGQTQNSNSNEKLYEVRAYKDIEQYLYSKDSFSLYGFNLHEAFHIKLVIANALKDGFRTIKVVDCNGQEFDVEITYITKPSNENPGEGENTNQPEPGLQRETTGDKSE